MVIDNADLLVAPEVHAADMRDRDGAVRVIQAIHDLFPWLRCLFADGAYAGEKLRQGFRPCGQL